MEDITIVEYKLTANKTKDFKPQDIKSSDDAVQFARQLYNDDILIYETSYLILLDCKNNIKGWAKLSQGGIDSTIVDNQLACAYITKSLARRVILVHNHPSGNTNPSVQDKQVAEKLSKSCNILGSCLLDSIILTEDSYYSFSENGLL